MNTKETLKAAITGIVAITLIVIITSCSRKPYESPLLKEANALRAKLEAEIQGKPNAADDYLKAKDVYVKFSSIFSSTKDRSELKKQQKDEDIKEIIPYIRDRWPMNYDNTLKLFDRAHRDLIRKAILPYHESVKVHLNKYGYEKGNFGFRLLKNLDNPVGKLLLGMLYPALEKAIELVVRTEAETDMTRTILALELYKRENGQYPENLDSLVQGYLQAIPKDPFTTKPLIYRKKGNKYILYSCGVDMDDDGGKIIYTNKIPKDRNGDLMF